MGTTSATYRRVGWAAITLLILHFAVPAFAGAITATLKSDEPVQKAWAILIRYTDVGVYHEESKAKPGRIDGDKVTFSDLPSGTYDLKFQTASGLIEGWDAGVPRSDYVEEQPLSEASRQKILEKMSAGNVTEYDDQVVALDLQGNAQNAAILTNHLRTRSFVTGAGTVAGVWTWRVRRSQWEYPDEVTWVPLKSAPYYALVRELMKPEEYKALHVVYARHLGGIVVKDDKPDVNLGIIRVPRPGPGISAVNPDGTPIAPIVIKPRQSPATKPVDAKDKE